MIAEVNTAYTPVLVVLDAFEAFVDGGPEKGEVASPGVVAVSRDRVAIDALGVALLRIHGAAAPLDRTPVFELDQIKRAAELQLGCSRGDGIRFITPDGRSTALGNQISALLADTGDGETPNPSSHATLPRCGAAGSCSARQDQDGCGANPANSLPIAAGTIASSEPQLL